MSFLRPQKAETVIPKTYHEKIETILGGQVECPDAKIELVWQTVEEARRQLERIPRMKDDLSQLKQEVNTRMKSIRESYNEKLGAVQLNPVVKLVSKKQASQNKSRKREQLREKQEAALAPLQVTRKEIDRLLLQLDSYTKRIDAWIAARD
ncbi:MAG: hypothetical protein JW910_07600 [Anaerolineae bacterium]|nr:hypothetical protein [Anaerolineae bacterium]